MTIPESPENLILALYLPAVVDATQPVVGADIGVPLLIYDLVEGGATVRIDPPLSGTMNPGDVMTLWLTGDSAPLDSTIIEDGKENEVTILRLPKGRLLVNQINALYYTLTRGSQNIGTSPELPLLYNKIRPGLKDTKPEVDGHSELELLLPEAIKNGVDADFVSAIVCVSYPYCRAYDEIKLKCNGVDLTYTVKSGEGVEPPNHGSATPTQICFNVSRAYLESAIKADHTFDFSYTVTDQLKNTPDTDAVWSVTQTVDEDLAGTRLPAPILREIQSDSDDIPGIIDLEKLGENPLLLIVVTSDNRFQRGDTIVATYTAKLPGQPDVVVTETGTVEADEFGQKKPCILQVPNDKVIADSSVTVTYQLLRGVDVIGASKTATATVTGQPGLDLPAPTVREAPNNTSLDPIAAQNTLTAVVDYTGMALGDKIIVTWTGARGTPDGGSHTAPPKIVEILGPQSVPLANSVVAFNLGKNVTVSYKVIRGSQEFNSPVLALAVQAMPDSALRAPIIREAADSGEGPELDVASLTGATIRIPSWPLIAVGQYIWMRLRGTNKDNSLYLRNLSSAPGSYVTAAWIADGYYDRVLAPDILSELKNLQDDSSLTVEFYAALGQSQEFAEAVTFPPRVYTVKALEELIVDTSPLTLSGRNFTVNHAAVNWIRTGNDPEGTAATRAASGGKPPYTYTSSKPAVVSVDNTGRIRSEDNGSATITVKDSADQQKTISVTASNVRTILYNLSTMTQAQAVAWVHSINGVFFQNFGGDDDFYNRLSIKYAHKHPEFGHYSWRTGVTYYEPDGDGPYSVYLMEYTYQGGGSLILMAENFSQLRCALNNSKRSMKKRGRIYLSYLRNGDAWS